MAVIVKQRYKLDIAPKGGWVVVYASQHDDGAREIEFEIKNQGNVFSIPASINVSVQGIKANHSYFSHSCSYSGNVVTMALADDMTDVIGKAICVLKFTNSSQQKLATAKFILNVDSDSSSEGIVIDTEAEEIFNQMLNEIRAQAASVSADIAGLQSMVGTPLVASTASAMTNHNKIYVYTGSESGYINGNWYYWNGSAWTSGGVYNSIAVTIDSTPTQGSNNAVSSGGVYDEITSLKEDLYENERFNKSEWENGGISASTGANVTNLSRIRTKSFLPWGVTKLYSTNTNVRFLVYAYKDGAYVGGWWNDGTFNPSDVKGVTSVDFDVFYRNPDFEGYQYRACIYINSGTARVETISGIYIDVLPVKDFLNLCVNNSLERVMRIPDSTDLDTLMSAGNYYVENYASCATMTNTPPEAAQGGRLWVGYGTSKSRPYQVWLSFSSKDEPYFYMRIRKADAWGKWNLIGKTQPVNIRVLGYNIGKFNYGFDHTSPHVDDINTKIVNYKKMFGKVNSDLMLIAELTDYIDTSDTINTDTTLIQPLFKTRVNFHGCASVTNLMASKLENDGGVYLRNNNKEYAGAVGRLVCDIGNRKLIISGGFLRVLSSAQDRLEAFKNYINSIIDYDYSIIYLDTNVLNNEERETLYSEAVAAGYTVCNGGYFGLINTLVPTDMYKPIDNIFVKGNIKVKNFEVLTNEYDNLASDHLPIVADLTLY